MIKMNSVDSKHQKNGKNLSMVVLLEKSQFYNTILHSQNKLKFYLWKSFISISKKAGNIS